MKRFAFTSLVGVAVLIWAGAARAGDPGVVVIGCKKDVEGNILAEMMAQLLEDRGFTVDRKLGLGGTLICFEALRTQAIDLYPEYSGTVEQEILKLPPHTSYRVLQDAVHRAYGMELLGSFGFQNTYALAVKRPVAEANSLKMISDLARHADLRFGFSHEFLDRQDGWEGLARTYKISAQPLGIAHGLAYGALAEGKLDVTDVYSTDGDIRKFDLVLLQDDRHYFPEYFAAPLARGGLDQRVKEVLHELEGKLSEAQMQMLNGLVVVDGKSFDVAARRFLMDAGLLHAKPAAAQLAADLADKVETHRNSFPSAVHWATLGHQVLTHLKLTGIALVAAMATAIPLGILVYRLRRLSRPVMYVAGVLQTIPSIALLAFMIPLFGVGAKPAIVALFLYGLLPILRNTAAALFSIDPILRKIAVGMGLTAWQRLRYIELPLAAPTILAGIKTSAVITIGTATLAAFIGAGGLGQPIAVGLETQNRAMILQGAIPAALLAILTELAFEGLEKLLIPRHLLQKAVE